MRRTPMPPRSKPLTSKASLSRDTPLVPGGPLKRATPLRSAGTPTEPRRKPTRASKPGDAGMKSARELVRARAGGLCELRIPGICLHYANNWHHRLGKGQGGRWLASVGMLACGSGSVACHGAVTNTNGRRAEYERLGWIVSRRSGRNPAGVPVWYLGCWVLLDDAGGITPCPAPLGGVA